jgi:hypothetical protein
MPALYAYAICLRYMPGLFACSICLRYMFALYACAICLVYLPALYACAICLRYMPAPYACSDFHTEDWNLCVDSLLFAAAIPVVIAGTVSPTVAKCFRAWFRLSNQRWAAKQGAFKKMLSSPPNKKPCIKPTPPKQATIPAWKRRSYSRDPDAPFKEEWLEDDAVKDWAFVIGDCVHCSVCLKARKKCVFTGAGKPLNDPWVKTQLTQHPKGKKHIQA